MYMINTYVYVDIYIYIYTHIHIYTYIYILYITPELAAMAQRPRVYMRIRPV